MPENKVKLFESQQIRTELDEYAEKWWFSVLDGAIHSWSMEGSAIHSSALFNLEHLNTRK